MVTGSRATVSVKVNFSKSKSKSKFLYRIAVCRQSVRHGVKLLENHV
jgi:hypothetical protein